MKVNTSGVRLRAEPTANSTVLMENIPTNAMLNPVDPNGAWINVIVNGTNGWVAAKYVTDNSDDEYDQPYTLEDLLPMMKDTFPYTVLAAIAAQESSFVNWRVHLDGTGHGLFGLDDGGLLPDFERWSGTNVGRGPTANTIPVNLQIEYTKQELQRLNVKYGSPYIAARIWHTGEGNWDSEKGAGYEAKIRDHERELFGN